MLRDMDLLSQSRVQQRDQSSPQSSSQPTRTDTVVGNMAADTCSSEEFTQGLGLSMRRESHSARCKRVSVSQPVQNDALLGIDPPTSLVLLGNGALTALLTLIPRAIAWPDVLANINILVNVIVTENPSAEQLIIKHGGISLLLKAADQSSKAYLEMKIRTEKNTTEISQGLLSDTFINSSIVRDSVGHESSAKQYVNSTKKFTTCHPEEQEIYSSASITTHSSQHIPENRSVPDILQPIKVDEVEAIRTISMENKGIVYGLLKKFYGSKFIEFMDKSDKHTKTEIIQSMLSIFEKIEILLEIISCISLDLSLDDAVEQLVNDASRLVDCELVLFYLVDRETDELVAYEAHSMSMDSCEREVMGKANFPPGYGIAGHAAQIGKLVCVRDPLQSEMFHEDIDYRGGNGQSSLTYMYPHLH
ncbi:hypothetical protein BASA81_016821 [Batrachochytrium salamandrivorans]|nr:hypothetical protein BASA81_016821 [Batrachochytrium salamandrivorans]